MHALGEHNTSPVHWVGRGHGTHFAPPLHSRHPCQGAPAKLDNLLQAVSGAKGQKKLRLSILTDTQNCSCHLASIQSSSDTFPQIVAGGCS